MVQLRMGKRRVMPFLNKEKAKSFKEKLKKQGYSRVGMGKRKNIYWVIVGNIRKKKLKGGKKK